MKNTIKGYVCDGCREVIPDASPPPSGLCARCRKTLEEGDTTSDGIEPPRTTELT